MYIGLYVFMFICIFVYMSICIYVYMHICIHVYLDTPTALCRFLQGKHVVRRWTVIYYYHFQHVEVLLLTKDSSTFLI